LNIFQNQTDPAGIGRGNEFSARKNYATHLIDIALLMANVSQLKAVLDFGEKHKYVFIIVHKISFLNNRLLPTCTITITT